MGPIGRQIAYQRFGLWRLAQRRNGGTPDFVGLADIDLAVRPAHDDVVTQRRAADAGFVAPGGSDKAFMDEMWGED